VTKPELQSDYSKQTANCYCVCQNSSKQGLKSPNFSKSTHSNSAVKCMQDQKNQGGVCCHYVKEKGRDYKTKADTQQRYQPLVFRLYVLFSFVCVYSQCKNSHCIRVTSRSFTEKSISLML